MMRGCDGACPAAPMNQPVHSTSCVPQVELFCISKLINCVLETDEEFVCMDFHFAVRQEGRR